MSRRIAQSSVNWAALSERVPPTQRTSFIAFKSKSDKYLRSVTANPENPPKIDWAAYQKTVPIAGMVDAFQKQYDALKVPYPADTVSSQIDAQKSAAQKEIEKFVADSKARIVEHESALVHLKNMLPFNQMTMEDYRDAYPDLALDPINRPTLWPHTPEEQPENNPKEEAHH